MGCYSNGHREAKFEDLVGKTLAKCAVRRGGYDDEVRFELEDGSAYVLHHEQDCFEGVDIEDVCGDVADLVGSPIFLAEEASNGNDEPPAPKDCHDDSWTWTFYKLATVKGSVMIRWFGSSNGYYSESVDCCLEPSASVISTPSVVG